MIKGVYTALITPFLKNKSIDYVSLCFLLQRQEQSDVNGVVLLGTTAEEYSLSVEECEKIISIAKNILKTKQIIVGISSNCTNDAIEKIKIFEKFNADAYLVTTPYHNKPTQKGLLLHFSKIAKCTQKPIILYNNPSRCAVNIEIATIRKLTKFKNIVAIKEASGNVEYFSKLISEFKNRLAILCGNDNMFLPMLSCGACGCVSVASNLVPSLTCFLYKNHNKKPKKCTFVHNRYYNFFESLFLETNPICIKYLMFKLGLCKKYFREPLCLPSKKTQNALLKIMDVNFISNNVTFA